MEDETAAREIDVIVDALERDDPESALEAIRKASHREGPDDPVLNHLAGRAYLALDCPSDAIEPLHRAVELDPGDPDYRSVLADALFRCCRFDDARERLRTVLAEDPARPGDQELEALLLEREGRWEEAERRFRSAFELDPDRFPMPVRLDRATFEKTLIAATERLPGPFRDRLDEVAVTVEDLPSDEILMDEDPPLDPGELLGLFVGVSLPDRTHMGPGGELPPRILLFKRNLERLATSAEELRDQISVTLYHELGHYLGLDEDDLEAIDLG